MTDLPDAARKALAYYSTLKNLGFRSTVLSIVACDAVVTPQGEMRSSPGRVSLVVSLALDGDFDVPDYSVTAGFVDAAWWTTLGPDALLFEWQSMTQGERESEWLRWMSAKHIGGLIAQLLARRIRIPIAPSTRDMSLAS